MACGNTGWMWAQGDRENVAQLSCAHAAVAELTSPAYILMDAAD